MRLLILIAAATLCQAFTPYVVRQMEIQPSNVVRGLEIQPANVVRGLKIQPSNTIGEEELEAFRVLSQEWETFKAQHGKNYSCPNEDKRRMNIFLENKLKIAKHNVEYEQGLQTFTMGMNQFGDMEPEELFGSGRGFSVSDARREDAATFIAPENMVLPKNIDWRTKGAVTDVKDEGHSCYSDWVFSALGALEGQHFRKTGKLISLSAQNAIDCTRNSKYQSLGCHGGMSDMVYSYIKDNKGIDTETSYSYEARDEKCRYDPKYRGATDTGYIYLPQEDEKKLMAAVATVGPISVAIDGNHQSFIFYNSGIYSQKGCNTHFLSRSLVAVGYGTDSHTGLDYWIAKNSWGTKWGDKGYIKLIRNKNNSCGIASMGLYPLV